MLNNLMKWGQAITGIDYMNTLGWQTAGMYIYHIYYIYTLFTIPIYICINLFMYIYIYKMRARGNFIDTHSLLSLLA